MTEALTRALAEARALGFLGPGSLDTHLTSGQAFADALVASAAAGPALDLGSGGGVPGLILVERFPEWDWVLLDANQRRTAFLRTVVAELGLGARVQVVRARAETHAHEAAARGAFGAVTARSFGPPAATAEISAGFLRVGGVLGVSEPPESAGDRWDRQGLEEVGLVFEGVSGGEPRVATLRSHRAADSSYPRSWKRMQAKPLF